MSQKDTSPLTHEYGIIDTAVLMRKGRSIDATDKAAWNTPAFLFREDAHASHRKAGSPHLFSELHHAVSAPDGWGGEAKARTLKGGKI